MGKTRKETDVKSHKKEAREAFKDADLRTRVKPIKPKREKGGGNTWRNWYTQEEE